MRARPSRWSCGWRPAPFVGGAGVAVAAVLILLERTGKAVRSPARSALLARMAVQTGRGRGFALLWATVHRPIRT